MGVRESVGEARSDWYCNSNLLYCNLMKFYKAISGVLWRFL